MSTKFKRLLLSINYRSLFFALLGSAIIAFGTYNIHANSDIPEGGIIGLCLILEFYTGISPAISNLVINALCCVLAWRLMGTRYMLNAAIASLGFSAFYAFFEAFPPVIPVMSHYPLLAALVGATFIEIGTGIALRFGSAPSGEHALSMALARRGGFDLTWISFIRDFTVIFLSLCYADLYSVVYALLIMTITTPLTEYIVKAPRRVNVIKRVARTKKSWVPKVITGLIIVALLTGATIYLTDYYHADNAAIRSYQVEGVSVSDKGDGIVAYVPEGEIKAGFVFYPGARVEYTSYAPLLKACAKEGILCVVVEMPYNHAFLGINRALDAIGLFPEIENWYIGGHSLGGSIAANCAANNPDTFEGVVLLAAYSTNDITDLRALTVYGSEDGVRNLDSYVKNKKNLPSDFTEYVIYGGNHAYFGMYGEQAGDNKAGISNAEQITQTAEQIAKFILE